jgi:hypothetical protein
MKTGAKAANVFIARLRCVASTAIALRLSYIATKTKPVRVTAPVPTRTKDLSTARA